MDTIKPYVKYKASGISWLGDVPEHWQISKAKHILFQKKKTLNPSLNCGSISFGNIVYKNDERVPIETKATYQELLNGEFLINPLNLNFDLKSLRTGLSAIDVVVSTGYIVLKNNPNFNKRYLKWLLHQFDVSFMKTLGDGVRQTLSYADFKNTDLPYISFPEQTSIANFLDYKTAKIDRFVFKKKQLIKLLNEQKTGIINDAVTKGLNPNATTKPSGIEWLGDIPKHWEVRKLKYVMKYFKGFAFKSIDFSENGIPIIKASNIKQGTIKNELSNIALDNQRKEFESARLTCGDIIITTVGSKPEIINSSVGQIAIIDDSFNKSYLNQNTMCIRPIEKAINKDFAKFFLISKYIRTTFDSISLCIVNQAYLLVDSIMNIKIVLPPTQEQIAIVSHIEKETAIINKTIATIEKEIALVQEYRTALIAEAVTGKIDVRKYEIPAFTVEIIEDDLDEELNLMEEEEVEIETE